MTQPITNISEPRWPQQQRFKFIRKTLNEKGEINREMLCTEFGISLQQATADISKIAKLEPNLLWYDKSKKRFRPCVVPTTAEKHRIDFDYCGVCGGSLDTGWECNKCGFDMRPYALMITL